jgi:DNA invertase Pin-like site-specific DNA recombinase
MFKLNFEPRQFYIYYRVSTSSQANDQAHGLDRQTDGCEKFAESTFSAKEYSINYYCDIGSSYNGKNVLSQLNKLIREIVPYSVIMIWDVSRLGRDTIQVFSVLRQIKRKHCVVISVSDYLSWGISRGDDKLFYHRIIDSETESDLKSSRAKAFASACRLKNIHIGTVPYGYKLSPSRKLVTNTKEQDTIKTLIAKYNELKSYTLVASFYNKTKMLYRSKPWTARTVCYLVSKHSKSNDVLENTIRSMGSIEV